MLRGHCGAQQDQQQDKKKLFKKYLTELRVVIAIKLYQRKKKQEKDGAELLKKYFK